ncbi:hypothetical protein H2203_004176 [Taxawa tesnikishii (nom. ined.)]|nr:hypothetical protein H2203_004176 [Dothideales sp. JES 119]
MLNPILTLHNHASLSLAIPTYDLHQKPTKTTMCKYEIVYFACGCGMKRLVEYCHFARNDINHQCFGAWGIKREWRNEYEYCEPCQKRTGQSGPADKPLPKGKKL